MPLPKARSFNLEVTTLLYLGKLSKHVFSLSHRFFKNGIQINGLNDANMKTFLIATDKNKVAILDPSEDTPDC